jgi:hypothetical protein
MSRWKRTGLAFGSAFFSELLMSTILSLHDHSGLVGIEAGLFAFSIFVLPGWLLSLPFILSINRIDGWRLWVLAVPGILIGPSVIAAWAIVCHVTEGESVRSFFDVGGVATAISFISTAIYLTAFKLSARATQTPSS